MSTSPEALAAMSKEDLIGTIRALEESLAEAATGLMTEGSAQEYARLQAQHVHLQLCVSRLPSLIRWWYGC